MINLDSDEAIARAATQGEWNTDADNPKREFSVSYTDGENQYNNAVHIANMNPSKTLEYIQCIRDMRNELDDLFNKICKLEDILPCSLEEALGEDE
jgi:hypothetical protein